MKTIEQTETINEVLTEELKTEILKFINLNWEEYYTASEMAKDIEHRYIYGPEGQNIHLKIDDIISLINVVYLEKNPLPEPEVVEPIVEEPIVEEIIEEI